MGSDGFDDAVVDEVGGVAVYDAFADPRACDLLGGLLRDGAEVHGEHARIEFHWREDVEPPRAGAAVRPIGAEQSNTSIVFDDALVLKAFRRVEAGDNPELEMLRFLSARDFPHVAELGGWYQYEGELMDATFGVVQRFVPNARDGWELALDELGDDPERFVARLRDLGAVIGRMHTVLASDPTDPAFAPEEPSDESLALLTATIDEEIERVFLDLPDTEAVAPIAGHAAEVRDRLQLLSARRRARQAHPHPRRPAPRADDARATTAGSSWTSRASRRGRCIERRRKRSPLRDVAGMLRSFAYAASRQRHAARPPGARGLGGARARGLPGGYLEAVDPVAAAPRRGADRAPCCRSSSSRRPSTSCATSSTTGRTGSASRSPASPACSRSRCDASRADIEATGRSRPGRSAPPARRAPARRRRGRARLSPGGRARSPRAPRAASRSTLTQRHPAGLFEGEIPGATLPLRYELEVEYAPGESYTLRDPYPFAPTLGEIDLHLAGEGRHEELYEKLGAHVAEIDGVTGRRLRGVGAVGALGLGGRRLQLLGRAPAPDALARRVGHLGAVRPRRGRGLALQVRDPRARTATSLLRADPFAFEAELPPKTASVVQPHALRVDRRRLDGSCASRATRCASRCRSTRSTSAPGG